MGELFPVVAGVCIGFVVQRAISPRMRMATLVFLSIVAGFIASYISGELWVSWDFLLFDIPLVLIAAFATWLVLVWQANRTAVG